MTLEEYLKKYHKKYRKHPEKFAEDMFGIKLPWYQKILIKMINSANNFNIINRLIDKQAYKNVINLRNGSKIIAIETKELGLRSKIKYIYHDIDVCDDWNEEDEK